MQNSQLFSRRTTERKVDFRPDVAAGSPFSQLRRLSTLLAQDNAPAEDITGCDDALNYLREFAYRKTFTGTTHEEFVALDKTDPEAIDWLLGVAGVESNNFQRNRK